MRGVIRIRWNLGSLERPPWKLDEDLLDPDHNSERPDGYDL